MITVAAVCVGKRYGTHYINNLASMVERHLPGQYRFVCLIDETRKHVPGVQYINVSNFKLPPSWFCKMLLFNRDLLGEDPILFIDLDMIIKGDLTPLVVWEDPEAPFGICGNFTRVFQERVDGKATWPCKYGSCVMRLPQGDWGQDIWEYFNNDSWEWMSRAKQMGDQWIIEQIVPEKEVTILQDVMPENYFYHYRDFIGLVAPTKEVDEAAILVFAGKTKPDNCQAPWIEELWK